jgi:Transport and Golgi organisation 2
MCTVTVIPLGHAGGFRVACNRDERRTRPPARPPEVRGFGPRRGVMPVDPEAGGTWVAANDAGLVLTLLNYNTTPPARPAAPASRGLIIPSLLECETAEEAAGRGADLVVSEFQPFRLVMLDRNGCAELTSDGRELALCRHSLKAGPLLFTSSGLGDDLVAGPRRELFFRTMANAPDAAGQDAFHRHRWPGRPEVSVCMSRGDASTVSFTVVELVDRGVTMFYRGAAPLPGSGWSSREHLTLPVATPP